MRFASSAIWLKHFTCVCVCVCVCVYKRQKRHECCVCELNYTHGLTVLCLCSPCLSGMLLNGAVFWTRGADILPFTVLLNAWMGLRTAGEHPSQSTCTGKTLKLHSWNVFENTDINKKIKDLSAPSYCEISNASGMVRENALIMTTWWAGVGKKEKPLKQIHLLNEMEFVIASETSYFVWTQRPGYFKCVCVGGYVLHCSAQAYVHCQG